MTTGEYLVSLSGLTTGTALQHLLAIQARIGTGLSGLVLVSRVFACTAEEQIRIVPTSRPPRVHGAPARRPTGNQAKACGEAFAFSQANEIFVACARHEAVVIQKTRQEVIKTVMPDTVITSKPKAI